MNIINKKHLALFLASASMLTAAAQESSTGYFLENYNMRWQMNPAMGNRNGYVGMPALGNVDLGISSNFKLTNFVFPYNGKTVLFTNPNISAEQVLGNMGSTNRLTEDLKLNIIQVGFKAFGGYNNIAINVRQNLNFDLPKDLISLLKEGITNKDYDITNFRLNANAYAEVALNHSRDIKWVPGLRAGISLKALLPVAYAEANFNDLHLDLQKDNWRAIANAQVNIGLQGIKYDMDRNETTGNEYVSGVNMDDVKFGINGFGFAVDLGATYDWKDFRFSLALTDLGMLSYKEVNKIGTNGTATFETNDHVISIGDDNDSWDDLTGDLAKLYELKDLGSEGMSRSLMGTLRAGVDYTFPFYKKLHFGLLNTTHFNTLVPNTEFRLSANVEPVRGVALAVSGATGTFGTNAGFLLSLGNKGINFTIGMDYMCMKMDKNHIPLDPNVDVHVGLNFPF